MRNSKLSALLAFCAAFGLSWSSASSAATAQDYTFTFLGICQDCALQPDDSYGIGTATATLSVTNYVLGSSLAGHVADFHYNSDLISDQFMGPLNLWIPGPTEISPPAHIWASGTIDSLSSSNPTMSLIFDSLPQEKTFGFVTGAQGDWSIAYYPAPAADYGYSFTMTGALTHPLPVQAVPEPQTYAMLLAGLGLLIFTARRKGENKTTIA